MTEPAPMQALIGERLLAACEQAQTEHALLRSLTLLAAAMPSHDPLALLDLPLAERNCLLLQLRRLSFGSTLQGYASCPQCGTAMEFSLGVDAVLESMSEPAVQPPVGWNDAGIDFRLRQATTTDLLDCARMPTAEQAVQRLLARCLGVDCLSDAAAANVGRPSVRAHFDQLHADSEWRCTLQCPQCAHEDTWDLDIGHFVWMEARHAARRLLNEVHTLALHYGWSESAIVALSQQRRDAYLELLSA